MRKLSMDELGRKSLQEFQSIKKNNIVMVLDNIRSTHNIGSAFRTADALCIHSLYLRGITASPPNKEIHKTALGAELSINWKYHASTMDAIEELRKDQFRIIAIEQVANSMMLPDFTPSKDEKYALVFGNEVEGVQQEVINICDNCIEIPQYGTKHSFNVSVSMGIVLWDILQKIAGIK